MIDSKRGWLKSPREVWNLRRRLRALKFDITIDPQSLSKSSVAAWLSGAKRRIGFGGTLGQEISPWLNNQRVVSMKDHVVDRYLELLQPLGESSPQVRFNMPIDLAAEAKIENFLRQASLSGDFAVFNPGAGWPTRLWPVDRYGAVAKKLWQQRKLACVVVWAGEEELDMAKQIVAFSRGSARLAPKTSLVELSSLLRRARLFVGSDTGPLHLAVAVGTNSVSIYGPTKPEHSGPYGPGHLALQESCQTGGHRKRRHGDNLAMRAVKAEAVYEACAKILDNQHKNASGRRSA